MALYFRMVSLLLLALPLPACAQAPKAATPSFGRPHINAVKEQAKVIEGKVIHYDRVIYQGTIDVNPTLERIRAGTRVDHVNDGAYFRNFEGRLPRQRETTYYREFVHQMKRMPFPGPQRVVIGKNGEVYYTGDHCASFQKVH
jgi:filamentous hemagglutinin